MGKKASLVGSKFGRLTVVAESPERSKSRRIIWICKCDCGGDTVSSSHRLFTGKHASCGCLRSEMVTARNVKDKDLTGKTFGRLSVVGFAHTADDSKGRTQRYWQCSCECGQTTFVSTNALCSRNTASCGCRQLTGPKRTEEERQDAVLNVIRWNAESRLIPWELSRSDALELIRGDCHYCGAAPRFYSKGSFKRNGIDRWDNTKGYFPANCVSCCTKCNTAKMAMTYDEFLEFIATVYNRLNLSRLSLAS